MENKEVKKTTKKATTKKAKVEEVKVEENIQDVVAKETLETLKAIKEEIKADKQESTSTRKKAVDIDGNEMINVRSVTYGGLNYVSSKTGMLTRWSQYGDIQQMEYSELVTMKATSRAFLFDPKLIIDDEQVAEKLGLTALYKQLEEVADLEGFFGIDLLTMQSAIQKLPKGAKETVRQKASEMVRNGQLYDTRKIKMLERELSVDLMILLD